MRVLVFGDSITQGYWDTEGGWVDALRKYYDERQFTDLQNNDEPTIFNLGISADNSSDILKRLEAETAARTWQNNLPTLIVQIGVNDSCLEDGSPQVSLEQYKDNLEQMVTMAKKFGSGLVFVGSSCCHDNRTNPVVWGEHYYSNADIKAYETAMSEVAIKTSTPFIPVFDKFKAELDKGRDLLPDGLHPNHEGHQVILDIVKPEIIKCLK